MAERVFWRYDDGGVYSNDYYGMLFVVLLGNFGKWKWNWDMKYRYREVGYVRWFDLVSQF